MTYPVQWWPAKRCDARMVGFFEYAATFCGRPEGHEGGCWPVPMAGDREK